MLTALPMFAALALSPAAEAADYPMQAGLRARYMTIPDGFVDPYIYDEPGAERPEIRAWAAGLEYTLANPTTQWIFYAERIVFLVDDGYWDDVEEPPDHIDGQWIAPSDAFGLVAVGANAGKDVPLTDDTKDVWVDFHVSGGLGLGVPTGELTRWRAGDNYTDDPVLDAECRPDDMATVRKDECGNDGTVNLPPVVPLVDLNLGFQFHFTENVYLRLEGGLHDMLYGGGALGGRF